MTGLNSHPRNKCSVLVSQKHSWQFCHQMNVTHLTGLPYNPQGQGIVERAHRTLKSYLIKQKGGIKAMTPKMALSLIIFTLNFLKLDNAGRSPAERHRQWPQSLNEMVKWKNVLDNKWYGPDPILIRSWGAICVFSTGWRKSTLGPDATDKDRERARWTPRWFSCSWWLRPG